MEIFDLSVVTATYNEKENISLLIRELNKIFDENHIKGEVVVVDDSSPDGTSEVVKTMQIEFPNTVLVSRPPKLGIGSAYRDGAKKARGEVITLMDADFSQPPSVLPRMYAATKEGKVGWGSRYISKVKFESDIPHLIGTAFLNSWISFWLKTKMKDHTLGYFAIRKEHLNKILEYAHSKKIKPFDNVLYGIPIAAISLKLGIPIQEIEAPYEERKHGESKIKFWDGLKVVGKDMFYTLNLYSKVKK